VITLPENVRIRPATLQDLDAIVALWMAMMREHEAFDSRIRLALNADNAYRQYVHHYITRDDAAVFVAERGNEVIAFCLAYAARNLPMFHPAQFGYLSDLTVSEPWRGRGVGSALLEATKAWFLRNGIAYIQLQVYSGNAPGIAFWRKAGFEWFVNGMRLTVKD